MKMDDRALLSLIEQHERHAIGYYTGEIAQEQEKAQRYYLSQPMGNEEEGRSQVISSDVRDIVEGLTPIILKPFVSSDDVVRFNPVGPDDEETAQQESDYINWVVTQKNDVFNQLVAAVKTGLLLKNGTAKYWWEKSRRATIERYSGLTDDAYAQLIKDDDCEITEHTETQGEDSADEMGNPIPGEITHDVTVRVVEEIGDAKYCVLPPEEFLIGRDTASPNPQTSRFVQHRRRVTISDLREMGYDVEDDLADGGEDPTLSLQYQARRSQEEYGSMNDFLDPASREVLFRETFLLVDFDGDGMAELRKVCSVGEEILANEETEEIPFVSWTPSPQPFKFYGRCPADDGIEFQDIKTTLIRQNLDNIYTVNNNRVYVSDKVNMDDLLDNQIAGVVRIEADEVGNHIKAAEVTPLGAIIQPMIEYLDSAKENRTGFTRYSQGTDADSLNKTATGIRIIKEAGDARTELISRAFAEQFLAPLMIGVHGLCRRHATKSETIRLRGEWVEVDPRQWKTRRDMSVSVGLGTADQQMKMQGVQLLMQKQMELMATPAGGIVQPQNIYNAAKKLAETVGHKQPEQFFTSPEKIPPQQEAPPDPMIALKARELDIREDEVEIARDKMIGEFDLKANAQGFDNDMQVLAALERANAPEVEASEPEQAPEAAAPEPAPVAMADGGPVGMDYPDDTGASSMGLGEAGENMGDKPPSREDILMDSLGELMAYLKRPKSIVRDGNGRITGVQ